MDFLVWWLGALVVLLIVMLVGTLRQQRLLQEDYQRLQQEVEEEARLLQLCRVQARALLQHETEENIENSALAAFNTKRQEEIAHRKRSILEKLLVVGRLQTHEVADFLTVSRSTAYRYLTELVADGELQQVGEGSAVYYELRFL